MSEGINPELIEKAANALHADCCIDDDCDHYVNEWERDAETVLAAVLPDVVRKAKAQGWDEGHYMSDLTWRHIYDGHDCSEGEVCPTCCQPNPYRAKRIESQDNERINHDLQH